MTRSEAIEHLKGWSEDSRALAIGLKARGIESEAGAVKSFENIATVEEMALEALQVIDWILANCEVTENLGIHGSRTFEDFDEMRTAMKGGR